MKLKTGTQKLHSYRQGLQAEFWACWLLRLKGYKILAQRYKTPVGEIDIVARKGKTIAMVEVKLREQRESALEAVHSQNRHRVERAAGYFLSGHPHYADHDIRFDVITFAAGGCFLPFSAIHLDNAWRPDA